MTCGDCPENAMCNDNGDCACNPGYVEVDSEIMECEEMGAHLNMYLFVLYIFTCQRRLLKN